MLHERRASPGQLLAAIFADAIDELQSLMAASGFRLDQRINGSAFQLRILHRDYPTMIQMAAFSGAIRCFKSFLLNGSDLQMCDFVGRGVTTYAAAGGSTQTVRLLDERDCRLNGCLTTATLFHRNEIFDCFVEKDSSLLEKKAILGEAVVVANYYAFQCCLERGVDVNGEDVDVWCPFSVSPSPNWTALHFCARYDRAEMLEVLLGDERPERMRDKWPVSPLDMAVCARSRAICWRLLQDSRVDPSLNGTPSPLHHAVERGYSEILQTLLSHRSVDPGIANDSVWPCGTEFCDR
jgi:hypothetical protein